MQFWVRAREDVQSLIQAGDTIGPYTLVRTLARGAFGEVGCPLGVAERRSSLLTTRLALKRPHAASVNPDAFDDARANQ